MTKMTCFRHELRDPHHCYAGEPLDGSSLTCMSSSVLHIAIPHIAIYKAISAALGSILAMSGLLRHMCYLKAATNIVYPGGPVLAGTGTITS